VSLHGLNAAGSCIHSPKACRPVINIQMPNYDHTRKVIGDMKSDLWSGEPNIYAAIIVAPGGHYNIHAMDEP